MGILHGSQRKLAAIVATTVAAVAVGALSAGVGASGTTIPDFPNDDIGVTSTGCFDDGTGYISVRNDTDGAAYVALYDYATDTQIEFSLPAGEADGWDGVAPGAYLVGSMDGYNTPQHFRQNVTLDCSPAAGGGGNNGAGTDNGSAQLPRTGVKADTALLALVVAIAGGLLVVAGRRRSAES